MENTDIRLQKFIADCGVTSRRKAELLIEEGRVKVNGVKIRTQGFKVDPKSDAVTIDDNPIDRSNKQNLYIVLNKPRGVVTTVSDPEGRRTVLDLLGDLTERIYPVGRLDYLSEGLLILTNDGALANQIMHPSKSVPKVYEVKVFGHVDSALLKKLREGVHSEVGFLKPASVRVTEQLANKTWIEFRLFEGKNREIRRLCDAFGIVIDKLRRVSIGGLNINNLGVGQYDLLTKQQLLKGIGFNKIGEYVLQDFRFHSEKRSKKLNDRRVSDEKLASNEKFSRYKKDAYYKTLEKQKENLAKSEDKKKIVKKTIKNAGVRRKALKKLDTHFKGM